MKSVAVSLLLTSMTLAIHAAPPRPPSTELPKSSAQVRTFENGLTVIVEEDHSAPVASVQAWCNTGSIHEANQLGAGLSHILEHMLFKGTEKRKGSDIARQIQDQGGYVNAYTSYDRTVYWIDVPSGGAAQAVEILADTMLNSTLPKEEYDKEQEVIRREFAMGFDDPGRMSSQLMFSTAFQESPYRHPVIGYLDVYNKLTRDDVLAYYKKRYVPNNLTFVVVGDVDAAKIFEQLRGLFADSPRQTLEPVYIPEEPKQLGKREMHKEFATDLTYLDLSWQIPGLANADTPALDLLARVLGDGRSSPFYREIREKKGLAFEISCGTYTPAKAGLFVVDAVTDPAKRKAVEDAVLAIIADFKERGVSAADLEKAKKTVLSAQIAQWTTMRGKASDLGSDWLLSGNLNFSRDYFKALQKVTAEDLKRVARTYLVDTNLTVTSLNPTGSLDAKKASDTAAAMGEIQKFELSNGLRLLVCEDSRLPLVSITGVFRGGVLAETPKDNGVTALMAKSLLKGTTTRTADQIAEQIESVGGSISSASGNNTFNVGVGVLKSDLKLGLEILADVLLNPSFPAPEVEREKQVQLAGIKAEDDQITAVAQNYLRKELFGDHPYALRTNGSLQSVEGLKVEDLKTAHNRLVAGKNGVIAVFGDVKAAEVKAQVEKLFAKMKPGEMALQNAPAPKPLSAPVIANEHRDKQQAVVMMGYQTTDILNKDFPALQLIDEASGDLGSRFFVRIRDKNALAYFVGAAQLVGPVPGGLIFYMGTDPKKKDKAKEEFLDEIGKLAKEGLTEEELARAKEKLLGAEAIRNQSSAALAQSSSVNELMGLGYDYYKRQKEIIQNVTVEDTRAVAGKYIGVPGYAEVIVSPPAKEQNLKKEN